MRYLAPLLISLSVSPAVAKPIAVQSGEHEGFTRLVVTIDAQKDWTLERIPGRSYVLRIEGHEDGFDTKSVFGRIDRSRLSDLASEESEIRLDLACNCTVNAFRVNSSFVALDIKESDESEIAEDWAQEFHLRLGADLLGSDRKYSYGPALFREEPAEDTETESLTEKVNIPVVAMKADRSSIQRELQHLGMPELSDEAAEPPSSNLALEAIESSLTEQVSLAATQGLLTPRRDQRVMPLPGQEGSTASKQAESKSAAAEISLENTQIHGAIDGADSPFEHVLDRTSGATCPDPAHYAIADWSNGRAFTEQLATLRTSLYGEFDSLNEAAILPLARLYLHFGFGAEALQILSMTENAAPDYEAAHMIATYLEYGGEAVDQDLEAFENCDGNAAMWATLVATNGDVNGDAVLRTLSELPLHLRELLAPAVSEAFRERSDIELAEASLRTLKRASHETAPSASVEAAEIAASKGEEHQASEEFRKVASSNELEAPLALARMIDLHVKNDMPISEDLAVLAAAYAMEHRNTDIGPLTVRAHVLALTKSEQYGAAFQILTQGATDYASEMASTEADYFDLLAARANAADFLRHAFLMNEDTLKRMSASTRLTLAERMQLEGFAAKANEYVSDLPQQFKPRRQALLRAKTALMADNPGYALDQLEDYTGDDVETLRAEAMLQLNMFAQAGTQFAALGREDGVERAAWRAPDLGATAAGGSAALQIARKLQNDPGPRADQISLEHAENLISGVDTLLADVHSLLGADAQNGQR